MLGLHHLASLAVLAAAAVVQGAPALGSRAFVPPDSDDFYKPPAGFESQPPGAILRQRPIASGFFGFFPDPIEAHQLLYRTNAINGSAIATVTTVFKPALARTDRFVSFQTAYDAGATVCDPSYSYQLGSPPLDLIPSLEQFTMKAYLLSGYIVASPDYEGPDAAFTPGHLEGQGTLDGMRAVINFKKTLGLSDNPMIVGTGYSGGAIATGWAASLHPKYAPELNVKGWACGGTPANLTATLLKVDNTQFSGFLQTAIDGLMAPSAYGAELGPLVDEIITPQGRQALEFAKKNCLPADVSNFNMKSIFSTDFQKLGRGLLAEPRIAKVLQQNIMGINKDETPTAPVFLYHAAKDEIVAYEPIPTLYRNWCSNGADVQFVTYASGGHADTEVKGLADAVKFTNAAFAGTAAKGCKQSSKQVDKFDTAALGPDPRPALEKLAPFIDFLGPADSNLIQDWSMFSKTPSS